VPVLGEGLGLLVSVGEGLGLGLGDTDAEGVGAGLVLAWQLAGTDGSGLVLAWQLGDGDVRWVTGPDPETGWDGGGVGEVAGCALPGPGCPFWGFELELLGDTAVETLIAT
jgi:hypothetical protein